MKILVVEDHERISGAIIRALSLGGYNTELAASYELGLALARDLDFGLIILDRMLPGRGTGLDILKQIRSLNIDTPVLMLTAIGEVNNRIEGLNLGADDYLAKPFSIKELVARVNVLVRRPKKHLGSVVAVDNLELNTVTKEVKRNGLNIKLSSR